MHDGMIGLKERLPEGFVIKGQDKDDKRYVMVEAPEHLSANGKGGAFDQLLQSTGARRVYVETHKNDHCFVLKF